MYKTVELLKLLSLQFIWKIIKDQKREIKTETIKMATIPFHKLPAEGEPIRQECQVQDSSPLFIMTLDLWWWWGWGEWKCFWRP